MAKAKAKESDNRKTLIAIKGEQKWLDWLKEYAEWLGVGVMTAIDVSLRKTARDDGFEKPMPKRFTR
jgi:hypothetical protein